MLKRQQDRSAERRYIAAASQYRMALRKALRPDTSALFREEYETAYLCELYLVFKMATYFSVSSVSWCSFPTRHERTSTLPLTHKQRYLIMKISAYRCELLDERPSLSIIAFASSYDKAASLYTHWHFGCFGDVPPAFSVKTIDPKQLSERRREALQTALSERCSGIGLQDRVTMEWFVLSPTAAGLEAVENEGDP
jgi:hypothetical protein